MSLADGTELAYDYLLLAPGVRHSYFGHDDWEASAPGLKTADDAEDIRRRVLLAFEAAERESEVEKRRALLTFVVVGGGPTGVEVAGALAEIRQYALKRDFRRIDPRAATVMLLEGGRQLLPSYPAELGDRARESLRRLGVDVRTETFVTEVQADHVERRPAQDPDPHRGVGSRQPAPARSSPPSACRSTSSAARSSSPIARSRGTARCSSSATPPPFRGRTGIRSRGSVPWPSSRGNTPPPPSAATSPASRAAHSRIWDKGQLAVIGRGRGVADFGPLHFHGFIAWLAWIFVHIFFLIGFRNRLVVLIDWAISYVTYARGARVITGAPTDSNPAAHP